MRRPSRSRPQQQRDSSHRSHSVNALYDWPERHAEVDVGWAATGPTGCTGQPGAAVTSTVPAGPTSAGTPTPRHHRGHNQLQRIRKQPALAGRKVAELAHRWQRTVPDFAHDLPQLADALRSRSRGWKSDVHVGDLLGHAPEGFGQQREIRGADAALVVQVPQPPLGPVDEVGPGANPEPAEAVVPAHGGGLAHHPEQMAIA